MREVLFRVIWLLSRRGVAIAWAVLACAQLALTFFPLMDVPGYELASGSCLALTFLGPFLVMPAIRHGGTPPQVTLLALGSALPALLLAVARTWLGSPCDPFATFGFVPVLIIPSAMVVAAGGVVIARLSERRFVTVLAWIALIGVSALSTVWPLITGPQVFAFNHFGGYMPGPLYDEELSIGASLLWFRSATVLLALGVFALAGRRRVLGLLALAGFAGIELDGTALGFRATDQSVAAALGGKFESEELVLHYPLGVTDDEVVKMVGDLQFRLHQLTEFFGARPEGKVVVWWYRSTDEKQRLVGAAHTQFAKPWRREVHVNSLGFPHPVIKHELVHALAAPWGAPPFGVAASWGGLVPHVGVIEGFAVAADNPIDDLTLHQWCAAMKQKDLLPDVAQLMTPQGFYGTPHTRAYTTAGSFLRWLGEVHGKDKLRALYRDGDFEHAFGQPLELLAKDYVAFLDTLKLDAEAVNQAFGRFRRGSLFDRPCAREVARLSSDASDLLFSDPQRSMQILQRCRALQPDEPTHALAQAQLQRKLGRRDEARALLEAELTRLQNDPTAWADAALARADLAMEDGQTGVAEALWKRALELHVSPTIDRTSLVRLASLTLAPGPREAVQKHFTPGAEDTRLLALRDALAEAPDSMPVRYLLGRRLQLAGESARALEVLQPLLTTELPPSIEKETARLVMEAAFGARRCEVIEQLKASRQHGQAFEARAADWLERCRFKETR
jgi:tetratricopeptide (TPR) repeat protein